MSQPVWVLSVDLQTKTATFQSGMADAARSARKAFGDIGDSARSGGERAAEGMLNTRAALGILDNSIRGAHAQAMADLIRLFAQSKIVMAALPLAATAGAFLLIGGGAVALAEKIHELREEHEKLARTMTNFGTAAQNAFNSLDEKILQSEIRADELRNDHLGALKLQLQLINMQSMSELEQTFDDLAKKTDVVFNELKSHWYTFGIGAAGAKHALEVFQSQYDSLLVHGKDGAASSLLKGTVADAERVLAMQRQAHDSSRWLAGPKPGSDLGATMKAQDELHRLGVGYTEKEIDAQEKLVQALQDQEAIEQRISKQKKIDTDSAKRTTAGQMSSEHSAGAKADVSAQLAMGEQALAADRAVAAARLAVQRASIQARMKSDLDFAKSEYQVQLAANAMQIKALDKYAKDYSNQLKALQDKAMELEWDHATAVAEIKSKATIEQNAKDLADLQESERDKIDATREGSAARLAAIDSALHEEKSRNMQDLASYRQLMTERVNVVRQMAEEAAAQAEAAGKESSENAQKMGALAIAAQKENNALMDSARRVSDELRVQQETQIANQEYAIKLTALAHQIAALDKYGKDYENRLKALQDREKQLVQEHENEIAAIKDQATENSNNRVLSSYKKFADAMSSGLTQVMMRYETFGMMITNIGNQVVAGMMQNAIKSVLMDDFTKERDAARAARMAFNIGLSIGGPAGIILGPVFAAGAFAQQMAFNTGTDYVPGVGHGDTVPAMLTPGEGIVPAGVMDNLRSMARHGHMGGGNHTTVHIQQTNHVSTIDGDGMQEVLEKHGDQLQKHFNNTVRKMNK